METHALRKAHTCACVGAHARGRGGGGAGWWGGGWLSDYNFPLFLVYLVDMPELYILLILFVNS